MTPYSNIATLEFSHPRTNLGPRWTSTNEEDAFSLAFVTAYNNKFTWFHSGSSKVNRCMALEVPVNGLGIADLVALSWSGDVVTAGTEADFVRMRESDLTVRAFEVKLIDWKRGLMQAYRYTYFADVSILVMPANKRHLVETQIDTFRSLNVGFWTFNADSGAIAPIFTPRPRAPASLDHRRKAISAVWKAISQGQSTP